MAVVTERRELPLQQADDRQSHVGKLDHAWDEAKVRNWTVVSMKSDWERILVFEP